MLNLKSRIHRRRRRPVDGRVRRAAFGLLAPLVVLSGGCGMFGGSRAELISYKDPYFPETYVVRFDQCAYRITPTGDYRLTALAEHESDADGSGAQAGGTIRQFLEAHVYWKPAPGKTPAHSSTLDANLRYIIESPGGVTVYEGAGFLFFRKRKLSDTLDGRIESGQLHLVTQIGSPVEFIGQASITARLIARHESTQALDLSRQMDLLAGMDGSALPMAGRERQP
jgi:hypothetical protein